MWNKQKVCFFILVCPIGSFLDDTTCECKLCPLGTYSDTEDADSCISCPQGQTTFQEGSDRSTLCQPGNKLDLFRIDLTQVQYLIILV